MGPFAFELVVVTSVCLTIAFITWAVVNGWRQTAYRQEIKKANARLLDRIGSVNELREFISSDAGEQFLKLSAIDDKALPPAIDRAW
jgi:hypothetical protein